MMISVTMIPNLK